MVLSASGRRSDPVRRKGLIFLYQALAGLTIGMRHEQSQELGLAFSAAWMLHVNLLSRFCPSPSSRIFAIAPSALFN
ncbi:hypothetical protein RGR602_PC01143 (plasmid) [Rhizobium gallicum bv. gallicum R602sp]|uniref:Uncharacterized protein n=1 Tax=Rhizobium gallicum bv. gallicum R602sp TaxID=1041138 RepID=A0A0B4XEU0_9HYPH|nr:hypothetical protein RGR602_PC01143 [Rhizobium gallicum bv. gallicum R602sp]